MNILVLATSLVFSCTNSYYNTDTRERAYYEGPLDNGDISEYVNTNISAVASWRGFQEYAEQIPKSGDLVQIGDFQYVILSRGDYDKLWGEMQEIKSMYNSLNSNETGRVTLHGKRGHTTITNDTIQVEYADGYKHIETIKENRKPMKSKPAAMRGNGGVTPPKLKSLFEMKREAMKIKRKEAMSTTNEVTMTVGR